MYVFDTNVFQTLGHYYPQRFPSIWSHIDQLVLRGEIISVREARNELELLCTSDHVTRWFKQNRHIFVIPTPDECRIVAQILGRNPFRDLVRRKNILRASPVADPFIIAVAKERNKCVVTQELFKPNGARIPTVCRAINVRCIDLEGFFEEQGIQY